jgi:hypothetical protein
VLFIIHLLFLIFFIFSITINIKIFSLFFFHFLYHINNFFLNIQIKKFTIIQFFFHFFIYIFLLNIISLLFTNFKINNSLLCSVQAFAKQHIYFFKRVICSLTTMRICYLFGDVCVTQVMCLLGLRFLCDPKIMLGLYEYWVAYLSDECKPLF